MFWDVERDILAMRTVVKEILIGGDYKFFFALYYTLHESSLAHWSSSQSFEGSSMRDQHDRKDTAPNEVHTFIGRKT